MISEKTKPPLPRKDLEKAAGKILSILDKKETTLCILFVNDIKMRELNLKYRKADKSTDCLAFPADSYTEKITGCKTLGDVVISVDTAKRNARDFSSTLKKETLLYITHGILHLAGFKDITGAERRKMRKMEKAILSQL